MTGKQESDFRAGIDVVCNTCKEEHRFPYQSIRDAVEYDRFLNDCVRAFSGKHDCIDIGRTILIRAYTEDNQRG